MTLADLMKKLEITEYPEDLNPEFEKAIAEYKLCGDHIVQEKHLNKLNNKFRMFNEKWPDVLQTANSIKKQPDVLLYIYFLKVLLRKNGYPDKSVFRTLTTLKPKTPSDYDLAPMFALLHYIPAMVEDMQKRNVPDYIIQDTISEFEGNIRAFQDRYHRPGILTLAQWLRNFIDLDIFRIGRFNLQMNTQFRGPVTVFKRTSTACNTIGSNNTAEYSNTIKYSNTVECNNTAEYSNTTEYINTAECNNTAQNSTPVEKCSSIENSTFAENCTPVENNYTFENSSSEYAILMNGVKIHRSGMILGSAGCTDIEGSFEANIAETDDYYEGFPVGPNGLAINQKVRLPKNEWQIALQKGDNVISVHIPPRLSLKKEICDASYELARRIYQEHYPEYKYKAFVCHSWMMDPQISTLLGKDTNIPLFQKKFMRYPLLSAGRGVMNFVFLRPGATNIEDLPEDTTLRRVIKKHLLDGKYMYEMGGVFF